MIRRLAHRGRRRRPARQPACTTYPCPCRMPAVDPWWAGQDTQILPAIGRRS